MGIQARPELVILPGYTIVYFLLKSVKSSAYSELTTYQATTGGRLLPTDLTYHGGHRPVSLWSTRRTEVSGSSLTHDSSCFCVFTVGASRRMWCVYRQ